MLTITFNDGGVLAFVPGHNLYLTAAGGASGSETRYATDITTSTYNMSAAVSTGIYGATVPPTVNTTGLTWVNVAGVEMNFPLEYTRYAKTAQLEKGFTIIAQVVRDFNHGEPEALQRHDRQAPLRSRGACDVLNPPYRHEHPDGCRPRALHHGTDADRWSADTPDLAVIKPLYPRLYDTRKEKACERPNSLATMQVSDYPKQLPDRSPRIPAALLCNCSPRTHVLLLE
jgi:hypothetical protein